MLLDSSDMNVTRCNFPKKTPAFWFVDGGVLMNYNNIINRSFILKIYRTTQLNVSGQLTAMKYSGKLSKPNPSYTIAKPMQSNFNSRNQRPQS